MSRKKSSVKPAELVAAEVADLYLKLPGVVHLSPSDREMMERLIAAAIKRERRQAAVVAVKARRR